MSSYLLYRAYKFSLQPLRKSGLDDDKFCIRFSPPLFSPILSISLHRSCTTVANLCSSEAMPIVVAIVFFTSSVLYVPVLTGTTYPERQNLISK